MKHFIVFCGKHPAQYLEFPDADLALDWLTFFERQGVDVVLLGADSIETLKQTHGHYWKDVDELLGGVA